MDHLRNGQCEYTDVYCDLRLWMSHEPDLMNAKDLWEFKRVMARESFFHEGHEDQVDFAYRFFLENLVQAAEQKANQEKGKAS